LIITILTERESAREIYGQTYIYNYKNIYRGIATPRTLPPGYATVGCMFLGRFDLL